jgi:hypothetical protein
MVVLLSRIQFTLWVDFQGLRHSRMWICSIGGIRVRNSSMPGQPNAEGFRFCKLRGRGSPVSMRADSGTGIRTVGRMSRPFAVPHSFFAWSEGSEGHIWTNDHNVSLNGTNGEPPSKAYRRSNRAGRLLLDAVVLA